VTARIRDGWIHGELPGPNGRTYRVEREPRHDFSFVRLTIPRPNLVLHTTQAPDLKERYKTWDFPPQFGVGDHRIVQLFPVWAQGKASKAQDARAMQIEITGFSNIARWLPLRHALQPLVALVAFLHKRRRIKTGLSRPTDDWPIAVDHLPAAVFDYYRRRAGLWPVVPGVYGHIELPGDDHWDPGGFDYSEFFGLVRDVLGGDEDMRMDELIKGHQAYRTSSRLGVRIRVRRLRTDPMISRKDGDRRVSRRTTRSLLCPRVAEPSLLQTPSAATGRSPTGD
jgi:hypothetical protein